MQFTASAAMAKIATAAAGLSVLLTGSVAVGANWVTAQIEHGLRVAASGSDGPITWGSLESEPAPEKVDLSTLIIAGTIDPGTGAVTDVAPHPADAAG